MNIKEGVSAVLIDKGKVLIVQRSDDDDFLAGYYELPGGKIEFGESREDAVIREIKEELALNVQPIKHYHTYSYTPGPNTLCHDYQFLVNLAPGENLSNLQLSPEHQDYKWVDFDDLSKILITDEVIKSIKLALQPKC